MSKEAEELEKLAEQVKEKSEKAPKKGKTKEKKDPRDEKIAELTETLQRIQAEFENYKKRVDKETASFKEYAKAEFMKELLPILDSFELAIQNKEKKEDFIKGVELIYAQLFSLLEKEGLRKIEALGKKFDPYRHDVLLSEKTDKEEDIVLEELQKGYMFKDKVLRHTKVKVSKKPEKTEKEKQEAKKEQK